ncbi:hypothetical protein [Azospirillum sp.]|uniref:hypothetical protein n=1 Tax=Azospirillum sp. TaxID=34012 RepID=UPI003D74C0FB
MEPSLTALIVAGSILGTVALDIGVNTLQNWYDTFYADAFWSGHQISPELQAQLAREEAEIDRLIRDGEFTGDETAQQP